MTTKKKLPEIIVPILILIVLSAILTIIGYKTFYTIDQTVDWIAMTAIGTVIIALCSLCLSLWQGFETQKNYRLSVTPKLCFIESFTGNIEILGLSLQNQGIGPAIISKVELSIDGIMTTGKTDKQGWYHALCTQILSPELSDICAYHFDEGSAIIAGEKRPVIYLPKNNANDSSISQLRKALSRCKIKIHYASIYDDKYEIDNL